MESLSSDINQKQSQEQESDPSSNSYQFNHNLESNVNNLGESLSNYFANQNNQINNNDNNFDSDSMPFSSENLNNNENYSDLFNNNHSKIEEYNEESEENDEETYGYEEKKNNKKKVLRIIVNGLNSNNIIEIQEKLKKMENIYAYFIKCVEKGKNIYQQKINKNKEDKNNNKSFSITPNIKKPNKIFRCLNIENGILCNEIPSIKRKDDSIEFSCENKHKYEKTTNELLKLYLEDKLFRDEFECKIKKKCLTHEDKLLSDFCYSCLENVCEECKISNHIYENGEEHMFITNNINFILNKIKNKQNICVGNENQLKKSIIEEKLLIGKYLEEINELNYENDIKISISKRIINKVRTIIEKINDYIFF